MLNSNIENFKCLVRLSHFTKDPKDYNTYHNASVFGIQSITGKILTFHLMTDYGMMRSRVPISEIFLKRDFDTDIPADFKQLWDCFSENVSVIKYDFLSEKRCQVILKDKKKVWGTYLFTVDWFDNGYSNEPSDYKCGHVIVSDHGYLMCQPNNRIYWKDSNWVTKNFPDELRKTIKVDTELISVESVSDRWVTGDSNEFYYGYDLIDEDV